MVSCVNIFTEVSNFEQDVLVRRNDDNAGQFTTFVDREVITYGTLTFTSTTLIPAVICTSRESREESLKVYTKGFRSHRYGVQSVISSRQAFPSLSQPLDGSGFYTNPRVERYHIQFDSSALVADLGRCSIDLTTEHLQTAAVALQSFGKDPDNLLLKYLVNAITHMGLRRITIDITGLGNKDKILKSTQYLIRGALCSAWTHIGALQDMEIRYTDHARNFDGKRYLREEVERSLRKSRRLWAERDEEQIVSSYKGFNNLVKLMAVRRPYPSVRFGELGSDMVDEKPMAVQSWTDLGKSLLGAVIPW